MPAVCADLCSPSPPSLQTTAHASHPDDLPFSAAPAVATELGINSAAHRAEAMVWAQARRSSPDHQLPVDHDGVDCGCFTVIIAPGRLEQTARRLRVEGAAN